MNHDDRQEFIEDLDYFFCNNLLFIGKYDYTIEQNGINKPSKAIKNMLYFRLQPYVSIFINNYLYNLMRTNSENFPSIPINENYDNKCINNNSSSSLSSNPSSAHAINLRTWKTTGIEFKNSWGIYISNNGLKK
jgi:hypothetical protein